MSDRDDYREQSPAFEQPDGVASLGEPTAPAPVALRAKGFGNEEAPPLTYSGPDEDGEAKVIRSKATDADAQASASRRDRRAEQRAETKGKAKPPKSKKRR